MNNTLAELHCIVKGEKYPALCKPLILAKLCIGMLFSASETFL